MAKNVFVVNTCNVWKEYASYTLVGIFTTRKKLNPILNRMLKEEDICWNDTERTDRFVNKLSDEQLHNEIDYISVDKINLNEKQ